MTIKKDGLDIAKNQVDNIYDSISSLQEFPNIGKRLDNYLDIQTDYLYLVIKKLYIAFYLLKDKEIHVIRILSCKQDYLKILELV